MIRHDDPIHQQLLELAYDAKPSSRRALIDKIKSVSVDEQNEWHSLLEEIDELRSMMPNAEISGQLEAKLIGIANQTGESSQSVQVEPKRKWMQSPIARMAIAACLAIGLGLVGYLNWPSSSESNSSIPRLSSSLTRQIASTATGFDVDASKLEINTSDPKELMDALSKRELPFAPAVLNAGEDFKLDGGSVVTFQGKPAVLTMWHDARQKYLLFQFDPKPLSMPKSYMQASAKGDKVMIWPGAGGECAWALVSNQPMDRNPFYGSY